MSRGMKKKVFIEKNDALRPYLFTDIDEMKIKDQDFKNCLPHKIAWETYNNKLSKDILRVDLGPRSTLYALYYTGDQQKNIKNNY